jgi:hypothetical protein
MGPSIPSQLGWNALQTPGAQPRGLFFAALGSGIRLGGHIHHNDAAVWSPHRDEYASREIADTIVSPPDTTLSETRRR